MPIDRSAAAVLGVAGGGVVGTGSLPPSRLLKTEGPCPLARDDFGRDAGTTLKTGAEESRLSSREILFRSATISLASTLAGSGRRAREESVLSPCSISTASWRGITGAVWLGSAKSRPSSCIARLMDAKRSSLAGSAVTWSALLIASADPSRPVGPYTPYWQQLAARNYPSSFKLIRPLGPDGC